MNKWLNVNELNNIIAQHFGKKYCSTVEAKIGNIDNQYNPNHFIIGSGGVLTIHFELYD